jgi:hypothetical protein
VKPICLGSLDVKGLFKDGLVEKWELWLHAKHILKLTRSEQDPELSVEKRYDYLLAVGQMTEHSHSRKTIGFARTGLGFGIAPTSRRDVSHLQIFVQKKEGQKVAVQGVTRAAMINSFASRYSDCCICHPQNANSSLTSFRGSAERVTSTTRQPQPQLFEDSQASED